MKTKNFNSFTNHYSLSKTLKFELRPVNADGEYIFGKDYYNSETFNPHSSTEVRLQSFLQETFNDDKMRGQIQYQVAKLVIDSIHQKFIEDSLQKIVMNKIPGLNLDLEKAHIIFKEMNFDLKEGINKKDSKEARRKKLKKWDEEKARIRKEIIKCFKDEDFEKLFDERLFSDVITSEKYANVFESSLNKVRDLISCKLTPEQKQTWQETVDKLGLNDDINLLSKDDLSAIIAEFKGWTVYFKGYHETRKNFYKDEKSTSIAFRLVDDNLTKFFKNILAYEAIEKSECLNDIKDDLLRSKLKDLGFFKPSSYVRFITQSGIDSYNEIISGDTEKGINQLVKEYNDKNNKVIQEGDKSKKIKLNKMFQLDKQILSDKDDTNRLPEFLEDKDLFKEIRDFQEKISKPVSQIKELVKSIKTLDLDRIYVINKGSNLNSLSTELFNGDYNFISKALEHYALNIEYPSIPGKPDTKKLLKQREDFLDEEAFSINKLNQIIDFYINSYEDSVKEKFLSKYSKVENYFFDFERIDKSISEKEMELSDN